MDLAGRRPGIRNTHIGQHIAGRGVNGNGSQGLLDAAIVHLELQGNQCVDQGSLLGVEIPPAHEMVGERAAPLQRPCPHGRGELSFVDHPILPGENSE